MYKFISLVVLLCSFYTQESYFEFDPSCADKDWRIFYDSPAELSEEILLVPRFDTLPIEQDAPRDRINYVKRVNQAAKEANATLREVIEKAYPYKYQLVSLAEVEQQRQSGMTYYLDLVFMPKQMNRLKAEALVPSFERHKTANRMYRNNNLQFHYYFYIRNLQTGDIYASTKPKGNPEVYQGINKFLKQIVKDL